VYNQAIHTKNLGQVLRFLRKFKNKKAMEIALKTGYSDQSNYTRIENGKVKDISFSKLIEISAALECSLFQVCFLLGIDFLNGKEINSEQELLDSIKYLDDSEKENMITLAKAYQLSLKADK
jgi:transcriptional regulator with XRE-family HTH domain